MRPEFSLKGPVTLCMERLVSEADPASPTTGILPTAD